MKRKVFMTIGLIASGKSTYAKNLVKENPNIQRVSRDDIRSMTTDYQFTSENEKIVDKLYRSLIETYLISTTKDIIMDEQNLNVERKEEFKKWILSIEPDVEFIEIEFPITLGEAIERDSKRERPIGKSVIKQTYQKYEIQLKQMVEKHKPKQVIDANLPWCCLIDIDGTLADSTNRRIFDDTQLMTDNVINPVRNILLNHLFINSEMPDNSRQSIFIMSGRKDSCKDKTIEWLNANSIPFNDIFMRKADDNRKDTVVKQELYEQHIKGKYNVAYVVDDRPSVCQMWINNGLFVFNVNQDPLCKNNF